MAAILSVSCLGPLPARKLSDSFTSSSLKPITVTGNPSTFVSAPDRRIVAVGDLHGDLAQTRCALEMAGVLSSDGQDLWTGRETVLIQVGDILDRGENEIAILSLLRSLSIQAEAHGGAVFQVNGNHETMNVEGDFRYVELGAFEECIDFMEYFNEHDDNWDKAFLGWINVSERWKEGRRMLQRHWGPWKLMKSQRGVLARSSLLRPGGLLACELARHAVILKVDDWVFCHGGLLPHHVAYGIERINKEVSNWMRGFNKNSNGPEIPFIATRGYDSVVWNRLYSRDTAEVDYRHHQICSILEETLEAVGAKGMVVGHTPQPEGVNCKCNHSIWRIDVGMSSGVLNSRPELVDAPDYTMNVHGHPVQTACMLQTSPRLNVLYPSIRDLVTWLLVDTCGTFSLKTIDIGYNECPGFFREILGLASSMLGSIRVPPNPGLYMQGFSK